MSESQIDNTNVTSTNHTLRTQVYHTPTNNNNNSNNNFNNNNFNYNMNTQSSQQQVKQQNYMYISSARNADDKQPNNINNMMMLNNNTNNIYAITNQIQQRSIDLNLNHYSYLNDDAIIEEYQKSDFILNSPAHSNISKNIKNYPSSNTSSSHSLLVKLESTLSRINHNNNINSNGNNINPSEKQNEIGFNNNEQNQEEQVIEQEIECNEEQKKIKELEKELNEWKQKYANYFYNTYSLSQHVQSHLNNLLQLQSEEEIREGFLTSTKQKLDNEIKNEYPINNINNNNNNLNNNNTIEMSQQLEQQYQLSKQLMKAYQDLQQENNELKQIIQEQQVQMQRQQQLIRTPIIRQTQLREEIRKEIEDKLINKHKQEINLIITKFSREKALMIKTIELQRLRILDNERIMLQMEGDLDNVKDSYLTLTAKQSNLNNNNNNVNNTNNNINNMNQNTLTKKIMMDTLEIPEETSSLQITIDKSENRSLEKKQEQNKQKSSLSSVLSPSLQSPSSQSNQFSNTNNNSLSKNMSNQMNYNKMTPNKNMIITGGYHSRKNKSFENTTSYSKSNNNIQQNLLNSPTQSGKSLHSSFNTNIPSSLASSGRNHHQRISSITTAPNQSINHNNYNNNNNIINNNYLNNNNVSKRTRNINSYSSASTQKTTPVQEGYSNSPLVYNSDNSISIYNRFKNGFSLINNV